MSRAKWIMCYVVALIIGAFAVWISVIIANHFIACTQDTYLTPHAGTEDCAR